MGNCVVQVIVFAHLDAEKKHFLLSDDKLAHTLMMGSDGFAIGYGLIGRSRRSKAIVEDMCDIIFGIK